jgi:PPP family 3-phenylpropionic acid transporter
MRAVPGRLLSLRLYYFASFAALGVYAPFFPQWLEARGVRGAAMGAVAALVPAMGVLGPPAVGILADAVGLRGSVLRACAGGSALAMCALAAWGPAPAPALIFATVLVYAVFRSPMVLLADVVAMERASEAGTSYGKLRLWGSVGFLVASVATGRAVDPRAPAALPAAVAVALLVALVAAWRLPAKPPGARTPVVAEARALLRAPDFTRFLVVSFLAQSAQSAYDLCFSLRLRDLGAPDARVGVAWALGVVFEVALMAYAEPLLARFGAPRLVAIAVLGAAVRWALLAAVPAVPLLLLLQPLHAVSFALWWVASLAYTRERAPAHALATAQGAFSAAVASGSVVGMLAWGALYQRFGGAAVFGVASAVALGGGIVALSWAPRAVRERGVR